MRKATGIRTRTLVALVLTALVLAGSGLRPAHADVSAVTGSAFGAYVKAGLFGGEPNQVGPGPTVSLPATGGNDTKSLPSMIAQFGPATIFGGQYQDPGRNPSGELKVSTEGRTGADGFVTTTASVVNIGPGPMIADKMTSTCTAKEAGVTASTTVTKGIVETSYNRETQEAATTEAVPERPAPNTAISGTIDHVGDHFRIVFNEQVVENGIITVRAAHMYLLGPIAVGDLIVGESICGVTKGPSAPTTRVTQPVVTTTPTTVPTTVATTVPVTEPTTVPITEPSTTLAPEGDEKLSGQAIRSESDGGGGGVVVGLLAVAALLGAGTIVVIKRRRRGPAET